MTLPPRFFVPTKINSRSIATNENYEYGRIQKGADVAMLRYCIWRGLVRRGKNENP
jgi:hypothetical protein